MPRWGDVSSARTTRHDLRSLYTGIEYLRYIGGEKRLVFVTQRGLFLPRLEDDPDRRPDGGQVGVARPAARPHLGGEELGAVRRRGGNVGEGAEEEQPCRGEDGRCPVLDRLAPGRGGGPGRRTRASTAS